MKQPLQNLPLRICSHIFSYAHIDIVVVFPQTELAMRGSGGFIGTVAGTPGVPGPGVTKKVAVVRVWLTFGLKR